MKLYLYQFSPASLLSLCETEHLTEVEKQYLPVKLRSEQIPEQRKWQHKASRTAQEQVVRVFLREKGKNWWQWEQENYAFLKGHQQLQLSLSHTRPGLGACYGSTWAKSVGLDIEWSHRAVKKGVEKFYIRDEERALPLCALEIWSRKEAAFKAISPLWPNSLAPLTLKKITLNSQGDFGVCEAPQLRGQTESFELNWFGQTLMVSTAIIS